MKQSEQRERPTPGHNTVKAQTKMKTSRSRRKTQSHHQPTAQDKRKRQETAGHVLSALREHLS